MCCLLLALALVLHPVISVEGLRLSPLLPGGQRSNFRRDNFVVLVSLSSGSTHVHMEMNVNNGYSFRTELNVGRMSNHLLFDNWWSFVPERVRPMVHVLCKDEASAEFLNARHVSHQIEAEWIGGTEGRGLLHHYAWRVKALARYLQQDKTVLISDIDALWLQDPLPWLEATNETVVGMREFVGWSTLNCGFVLFRPTFPDSCIDMWLQRIADQSIDDQLAFQRSFMKKMHLSQENNGTTTGTVFLSKHPEFTVRLLPVHQFPRNFVVAPGCSKCQGVIEQATVESTKRCCVDDEVVVLHHKGEIYREYLSGHRSHLWRLPSKGQHQKR
eukprot:gnl/TRDRNA2_/TRDRNA2_176368_c0_seq5.p1 gnl/TRDRNA2_/TRDRNA2_176368_c0~~gnl/TRDRNA2_/TRDRNA2_176368_c0_seq5.p1  ORF type:complete len:329 (+),score=30.27 gnl/TRDRNA2_/TRDRNA2_176368_c0_seq5:102-1088(+)